MSGKPNGQAEVRMKMSHPAAGYAAGTLQTVRPGGNAAVPRTGEGMRRSALASEHGWEDYATVLARLLEAADGALERDTEAARECICRALALLGADIARESSRDSSAPCMAAGGLAPWQIRKLVNHVEANCSEELRAGDMAKIARLSTSYFTRAFKASFGETPHAYVMRRRIKHAQAMMLETDQALGAIAIACGFADQAHFSRRFRQATGTRPQSWRGVRRSGFDTSQGPDMAA
jgi:AraC family transcriptional regulator